MKDKNIITILGIFAICAILAFFILRTEKPSMGENYPASGEEKQTEFVRGPHRGRLLSRDNFQVEVAIYETGVPPQFRIYPFENGKPINPDEVKITILLHRFAGRVDKIAFHKEADYLRGDQEIYEPHSFDVEVKAEHKGMVYQWEYGQVEGRLDMASETVDSAGIEIQTAGPVRMKTILELPGEIGLNKNRVAHVVPRLSGVVTEVRKNLGNRVKKGEVIAVIDSRELAEATAEYIESVNRLEFAQTSFVREEGLWKKKISPEQDFLASRQALKEAEIARQASEQKLLAMGLSKEVLKSLAIESSGPAIDREVQTHTHFVGKPLTRYELAAPLGGTIIEKDVSIGEAVKADADIFTISDLETVWGEITVYQKNLGMIRIGQPVTVRSRELNLETTGRISFIGALVEEETRTAKAHVDIANPKGVWRPGIAVTVEVVSEDVPVPIAVLSEAIQTFRDWNVVFVRYGNQFEIRPLELGRTDGKWVEVISGLSPGEKYAATNSFVLKADLEKSGATHDH